jgi:N6-L-threonylcarbamoyladenine synthase
MITLGIETSCDETACAVLQNGKILSNIVSSSVPLHEKYGGVIPEIASRFHIEYINRVTKNALRKARKRFTDIDLIAVTDSPGLPGSLLVGKSFARALSYSTGAELVGINHLHAHIYANFLKRRALSQVFPFLGVVVSGGHTNIFISRSLEEFETIGRTRDDAIGEAFDKVAKILGIGYPGGPKIEKRARALRKAPLIDFPRTYMEEDSFDFSLSGIKTAVFYYTKKNKINRREIARISGSFQEAVFDVLTGKIIKACRKFGIKKIFLGGGVISNKRLRAKLGEALYRRRRAR